MDVGEEDDHLEAGLLEVDELVGREHVADVEDAGGFVADVRSLALGLLAQRAYLLLRDHLGRVPGDPFVGVHERFESWRRVMTSGTLRRTRSEGLP